MTAPVDRTSQAIAMTAPVDRRAEGTAWVIAFTMPSEYTLETLPQPMDPRVQIREIAARRYAVSRFSGSPGEAGIARKLDRLLTSINAAGLARSGAEPTYARYDPPWTPGLFRRNELFVELARPPQQ